MHAVKLAGASRLFVRPNEETIARNFGARQQKGR